MGVGFVVKCVYGFGFGVDEGDIIGGIGIYEIRVFR